MLRGGMDNLPPDNNMAVEEREEEEEETENVMSNRNGGKQVDKEERNENGWVSTSRCDIYGAD